MGLLYDRLFIGSLTDQPRLLTIPLGFLNKEKKYLATIYGDDPQSVSPTHLSITQQTVTSDTILHFQLEAKKWDCNYIGGGARKSNSIDKFI